MMRSHPIHLGGPRHGFQPCSLLNISARGAAETRQTLHPAGELGAVDQSATRWWLWIIGQHYYTWWPWCFSHGGVGCGRGRGCGRGNNGGTDNNKRHQQNTNADICQLCGREGHTIICCFKRFDASFTGQPKKHSASTATTSYNVDTN